MTSCGSAFTLLNHPVAIGLGIHSFVLFCKHHGKHCAHALVPVNIKIKMGTFENLREGEDSFALAPALAPALAQVNKIEFVFRIKMKYVLVHWTESNETSILSAEFVKDKSMLKDPEKKGMVMFGDATV